jgi:hypothetical protein
MGTLPSASFEAVEHLLHQISTELPQSTRSRVSKSRSPVCVTDPSDSWSSCRFQNEVPDANQTERLPPKGWPLARLEKSATTCKMPVATDDSPRDPMKDCGAGFPACGHGDD